ncbi:TPA: hypothetical protein ANIA_11325 [Aspergillus nidulans FGSC A4]|uniref:Uncharacterized protein n=1 Tax=Emericella nidulans (strain FGSC A4 / ATCC 38163 / CBS 112.46 / NRRL 194 / M139) TaxID=227321 RepID=C8VLR1_EMENI|nr:TPA: hypothetical protein ANIA_11325 [Aspergillus nidulans FGSC A4]
MVGSNGGGAMLLENLTRGSLP